MLLQSRIQFSKVVAGFQTEAVQKVPRGRCYVSADFGKEFAVSPRISESVCANTFGVNFSSRYLEAGIVGL